MASTVATVATNVKTRLGVGTGGAVGSSSEPTDSVVQGWVRDAFKQIIGSLNPILVTSDTIASRALTLATDRIFYVEVNQTPLVRGSEYGASPTALSFRDPALNGETATIYYYAAIDCTGSTIDTSCIFGDDWLENLATIMASQTVCLRLSNNANSQGPQDFASKFRVLEQDRQEQYQWHKSQRDEQMALFQQWQQARLQFGKRPLPESAMAGFRNRSRLINSLEGRS
jgi:hypothetical protein